MNWQRSTTTRSAFVVCVAMALVGGCWLSARAAGVEAEASGRTARRAPAETAETPTTPTVYYLKQVKATDVAEALATMLQAAQMDVKIVPDTRRNALLIQAPPESQKVLEQMIAAFDVPPAGATSREEATAQASEIVERIARRLKELGTLDPVTEDAYPVTKVYRLAEADVKTVTQLLVRVLLPLAEVEKVPLKVVPAPEMNAIMVTAPSAAQDEIGRLIGRLDVPPRPPVAPRVQVFVLQRADASEVAGLLANIFDSASVRIAADAKGSLIVQAAPEVMERVGQLIQQIDVGAEVRPAAAEAPASNQVRIVWLASGSTADDAGALRLPLAGLPDDLKPVVGELAKVGLRSPRLVGQAIVNTAADGRFVASCAPMWEGIPAKLSIQGTLTIRQGTPSLEIELIASQERAVVDVTRSGRGGPVTTTLTQALANLRTTISAPLGHYVVLSVTPTEEVTSAFVVQVTDSSTPK